jgi:hypothetical protein
MTFRGAPPSSGSSDRRQELESAIAKEAAGLRRLEAEQAEAQVRLSVLRSELAALDPVPAPAQTAPLTAEPRTPADKVKLFRQLFRGRPDIYPTRFVSKKTGKPGYAPACSNKFVRGGSPVFDKDLQIVGLTFDINIEGLAGDFWYDERVNRSVAVSSAAIIHALANIYRAERIVAELGARK